MKIIESLRSGVARTIVTLFLLCGVAPLSLSSMVFLYAYYMSEKRGIGDVQVEIAQRIAANVSAHLEKTTAQIQLFAHVIDPRSPDGQRLAQLAHSLLDLEIALNFITIMDREGMEVCKVSRHYTYRPFEMSSRANDPSFRTTLEGKAHIGPISLSQFSLFPELPMILPIADRAGSIGGAIEVGVDVSKLWKLLSRHQVGENRYAYIVDSRGLLIAYEDLAPVIDSRDLSTVPGVKQLLTSRSSAKEYVGLENVPVVGASAPVPFTGWSVVVEEALRKAYRDLYLLSAGFLLVLAMTVSLTVVLGLRFIFSKVIDPIRHLQNEAGLVAKGRFDRRVALPGRSDEIGQLAEAFNAMASDLQNSTVSRELLLSEIAERKRAEAALKLEESRLDALLRINQMTQAGLDEIASHTLEEAVRLTESKIGYVAFLDPEETTLTMHAWSKTTLEECKVTHRPTVYPLETTGLWGEAVRRRQATITNDYEAASPFKKGLPEGHVALKRHMSVPIVDGDRIVVVAGVGNKETDYGESDVRQLHLLMLGMWRIVKRRIDEDALRESELKIRSIIEHSNNLFYSHTPDHVLTYVSPQTRQFLDCEPEEALVRWTEFATDHPINQGAFQLVEVAIRSGMRCPPYCMELAGKRGRKIWVEVNESPIWENGRTTAVVGALTDITDRVSAERALRENEEKYRSVVDQTRDWIFLVGLEDWSVLEANQTVLSMLGYSHRDLLRLHFQDLVDLDDRDTSARIRRALEERSHYLGELPFRARDATSIEVEVSANIVSFGGKKALCIVGRDLTERKKMEEELLRAQKIESVGVLAGGIAHDFNNILTAVIGNLSLARELLEPGSSICSNLAEMERACFRARDLTQQLLTFARGGAPVKRTVSIAPLTRESASFALRGSKARCEMQISDDLWPTEVDEGQITQVLNNLVINANQAMPEGGAVSIRAENIVVDPSHRLPLSPGPYVKIAVVDHGQGIAPEHLAKVFDPYFTTKKTGSGLGLAVAYSIMKNHGGMITVESEPEKGSAFYMYLPAATDGGQKPESERPSRLDAPNGIRVLVMDDEEMIRSVLGAMLEVLGCEVSYALDGMEAIRVYERSLLDRRPYDLLILDLTVPGGMGGKETITHLRQIDPDIRAIVSSGYSNDPVMANYREHGFVGVACKPFNLDQLREALSSSMEGDDRHARG